MPKTVWLVTHAETVLKHPTPLGTFIPDPEMNSDGCAKIALLRQILNTHLKGAVPEIHCGTGRRQYQVVRALGFHNQNAIYFSSLWGDASTLVMCDGKRMVLLGYGLLIAYDRYLSALHVGGETISKVIASLPNHSVICSGRPVLVRLGMKPEECHNGALYSLEPKENGEVTITLAEKGEILKS